MSERNNKKNEGKHHNRPTPREMIRDLDIPNVDETLETLDKGSPKLNWIYVLLAMVILFLAVWITMLMNPETSVDDGTDGQTQTEITEIQEDIESLERRIEALEN